MSSWKVITENMEQDRYDRLECRKCGIEVLINHNSSPEFKEKQLKHNCLSRRLSRVKRRIFKPKPIGLFE